jgi:hypothetical protein
MLDSDCIFNIFNCLCWHLRHVAAQVCPSITNGEFCFLCESYESWGLPFNRVCLRNGETTESCTVTVCHVTHCSQCSIFWGTTFQPFSRCCFLCLLAFPKTQDWAQGSFSIIHSNWAKCENRSHSHIKWALSDMLPSMVGPLELQHMCRSAVTEG